MYNSYEEYMQNVLGMNLPNTYSQTYGQENINYYYEPKMSDANLPEVNKLYPEIYGIVYPMVQKVCQVRSSRMINEEQINEMVDEVYNAIEPGDDILQGKDNGSTPRNGDVKNPRVRETRRPNNNNNLLRDIIRILIIRELLQGGHIPGRPRPPMGGMPGNPGGRPPMMGPRFMNMY